MLGIVPAAAVLLFSAADFSADLDLNAFVTAEARGGEAPVQPGDPSTTAFAAILAPGLDGHLRFSEADLRLTYAARLFTLTPNGGLPATEPFGFHVAILHVINLVASAHLSRRLTLTATGTASIGEPDYTALSGIFGPNPQGALPAVHKILAVSGRLTADFVASRIWDLRMSVELSRYLSYGDTGTPVGGAPNGGNPILFTAPVLPDQTGIRAIPFASARLTAESDLLLLGDVSYLAVDSTTQTSALDFLTASAEVGWRTHLSRRSELRVQGGLAFAHEAAPSAAEMPAPGSIPATGLGSSVAPVGGLELSGWLPQHDQPRVHGLVSSVLEYVADPVLRTTGSRSTTSARVALLFAPDWSAGLEAYFATNIRSAPLPGNPDETVVSVLLPIRRRLSDNLLLEGGLRGSDRGPSLSAPSFAFHQRELWVYLALTGSTRNGMPRLLAY